jgi:two-component system, response regulator, stage 0 sporulation protein F
MEKILCVDDDLSLLHLYQVELTEEGFKVILAKDGKETLVKFAKEEPNVVIMDIRMPIMDGIETLTAMLGKDRQVPVILNTAYRQYKENFMTWGPKGMCSNLRILQSSSKRSERFWKNGKRARNPDHRAENGRRSLRPWGRNGNLSRSSIDEALRTQSAPAYGG